jgi:hypothetical protein
LGGSYVSDQSIDEWLIRGEPAISITEEMIHFSDQGSSVNEIAIVEMVIIWWESAVRNRVA